MTSDPGSERARRRACAAALLSAALLVVVVAGTPQGLYSDPAWQVRAVQQYLTGLSPSPNHLVSALPADLSQDEARWISWWAPGTPLLVWPLMAVGLKAGAALRVLAATCLVAGAAGWALWIGLFALPAWIVFGLALLLPWMRYAGNGLFLYSAESLVFAAAPWILLVAHHCGHAARARGYMGRAFLVGLLCGGGYLLKYSLVFVSSGAVLFLLGIIWRYPRRCGAPDRLRCSAALVGGLALPILALSVISRVAGSTGTPASGMNFHPSIRNLVYAVGAPALALADAEAPWRWLLLHPVHGVTGNLFWVALAGVPGGVVLLWLIATSHSDDDAGVVSRTVFFTSIGVVFVLWNMSGHVSHEARHVAGASLGILPLALQRGRLHWQGGGTLARTVLAVAAIAYVGLPLAYGCISVAGKVARMPANYRTGPGGVYNALLSEGNVAAVVAHLRRLGPVAGTVWYLPDPISALDVPGRAVVRQAAFLDVAALRAERFASSKPLRVRVLLPAALEADGRGAIIRSTFAGASPWTRTTVPASGYALWSATLRPRPGHAAPRS